MLAFQRQKHFVEHNGTAPTASNLEKISVIFCQCYGNTQPTSQYKSQK